MMTGREWSIDGVPKRDTPALKRMFLSPDSNGGKKKEERNIKNFRLRETKGTVG